MGLRALASIACLGFALPATAHETGLSYLRVQVDGARIEAELELGLGDAAAALGLPAERAPDADPEAAREALWSAIAAQGRGLERRVRPALAFWQDGAPCPLSDAEAPLGRAAETGFAQLRFTAACPAPGAALGLAWTLPFGGDPEHRALVKVTSGGATQPVILSARLQRVELPLGQPSAGAGFAGFLAEGVRHIAGGFDHLLFLLALLLPAPLVWRGGWQPRPGAGAAVREVVATVTAFTVAHSLTLALSALGALTLPARFVEAAIAASVGVAALNGIRPFLHGRPWHAAFAFGLLHGLGFARYLGELGLPAGARLRALLAFNLGVELGQLAVVAVVLPPLLWLGRRPVYRRWGLAAACTAIAAIAVLWVVERLTAV